MEAYQRNLGLHNCKHVSLHFILKKQCIGVIVKQSFYPFYRLRESSVGTSCLSIQFHQWNSCAHEKDSNFTISGLVFHFSPRCGTFGLK